MPRILLGAFKNPARADEALKELERAGFSPDEISTISSSKQFDRRGFEVVKDVAKTAGGAAAGGSVAGGLAGLLAGMGVVPVLAGLLVGGPLVAALGLTGVVAAAASGAVTGAATGGLIGALKAMGVPQETATAYDEIVNNGGIVLGLSGHEDISERSRKILERFGASDIRYIDAKELTPPEAD